MVQASVGFHCTECARSGRQQVRTGRQLFGTGAGAAFRPLVTQVLIGINAAVFLLDVVLGGSLVPGGGGGELVVNGGFLGAATIVTGVGTAFDPLVGALHGMAAGEWWRLVTGGFLHDGVLHLVLNMIMLWVLGQELERQLGRLNFALLYFTSLIAGAFAEILIRPFGMGVGASGAVFGLIGGAIALQLIRRINIWQSGIAGLALLLVIITFVRPGISIGGHLGGLVGGFVAGWLLVKLDERAPGPVAPAVCVVLMLALFAASVWAAEYAVTNLSPVINV
jgi:membrane associated rhomboid family serine protease